MTPFRLPAFQDDDSPLSTEGARAGAALLVLAVCLAYLPVLGCGFTWDDDTHVTQNLLLRSALGLWTAWTNPGAFPQYYPVTQTSFWIEYHLYGPNPLGYHVVNVLLHAANACLVLGILRRLKIRGAWFCALLFALHPVHVESVAWITERKNVLSGFFYLSAALAYLRHLEAKEGQRGGLRDWWASLALFVLAVLSKSVAATLPAALALTIWWKRGRLGAKDILPLLPHFAVGLGFGLFAAWTEKYVVGAGAVDWGLSPLERFLLAGRIAWFYAGKLLMPVNQAFFYPKWTVSSADPLSYAGLLAALALPALLWFRRGRWGRGPLVASLFFLGTLFPVLGFLDVYPMQFSWVADHFQYLASLGVLVPAGSLLFRLPGELRGLRPPRLLFPAVAGLLAAALGTASWARVGVFRDEETLWKDTLAKNPASVHAHRNLGLYYNQHGRYGDAVEASLRAVEAGAAASGIYVNLGNALMQLGNHADALAAFEKALLLEPANFAATFNSGLLYACRGDMTKAAEFFARAQTLAPGNPWPPFQLGLVALTRRQFDKARSYLNRALELDPGLADARRALESLPPEKSRK